LAEVHQSLKLSTLGSDDFRKYCMTVYEAWEESGYLFIRSELCEQGNLNDYIVEIQKYSDTDLLPEVELWRIFFQMACSVKHVHDCGFVHLDIKLTNFFVKSDGTVKLGDFGMAKDISTIHLIKDDDVEGDSIYMAPELLNYSSNIFDKISTKADIFSLGASLLELASGLNLPKNGLIWHKLRQNDLI
jgi:mitosis inhibitor protein kinase SWE1